MSDLLDIALSAFDALIALWWEWMLPMAAQVAVLAGIVAAIDLLLVRSPKPRLESLLWGLVFLKLLVPPSLASPVSIVRLVAERPVGWSTADSIDPLWVRSAFIAWSLGVILLALLSVLRYRATARGILHRSTPAPLSVQHALAPSRGAWVSAAARRCGSSVAPTRPPSSACCGRSCWSLRNSSATDDGSSMCCSTSARTFDGAIPGGRS